MAKPYGKLFPKLGMFKMETVHWIFLDLLKPSQKLTQIHIEMLYF